MVTNKKVQWIFITRILALSWISNMNRRVRTGWRRYTKTYSLSYSLWRPSWAFMKRYVLHAIIMSHIQHESGTRKETTRRRNCDESFIPFIIVIVSLKSLWPQGSRTTGDYDTRSRSVPYPVCRSLIQKERKNSCWSRCHAMMICRSPPHFPGPETCL